MKLQAKVGETLHNIEIKRDGEKFFAKVDEREYELEASEPEANVFLLKHNGRVHEFYVAPAHRWGSAQIVSSRKSEIEITLIDPKRLRGSGVAGASADGVADIKTMMPGKVVRLIASVGDLVEKGDAVMVVEAMKMQNDLKAPKAGVVKEIRVSEGSTVAAGDVLAVIE
ncbi:MAG: biotin/lipoyl-containing protein [Pyrinomonadaceae bacterium]